MHELHPAMNAANANIAQTHGTDHRSPPIRLLICGDGTLAEAIDGCCNALQMRVLTAADLDEATERIVLRDAEIVIVDASLGIDRLVSFAQRLRGPLCVDWVPLIAAGDPARLRAALAEGAAGMVDHIVRKPFDFDELRERVAAARRVVSLSRAFRSTLDRVSEAVIVIDDAGRVHAYNAAAQRMFQWEDAEMRGASVSRLMPAAHAGAHDEYIGRYRHSGRARVIGRGRVESGLRRDGSQFPMHLTVSDISDSTGVRFVGVIRDLTDEQEREALRVRALHDSLTTLPNRAYAQQRLRLACDEAGAGGDRFAVVYFDLDRFKPINDQFGHSFGDEVLRVFARRARHALAEHDFVARLGGDEFLAILFGVGDRAQADAVVERVLALLRLPVTIDATTVRVDASAGIAIHGEDGASPGALLQAADSAMYARKRGRG